MRNKLNGILDKGKTLAVTGVGALAGLGLDHFDTFGQLSDYYGGTMIGGGLAYAIKKRIDGAKELEAKAYQKLYENENIKDKENINYMNNEANDKVDQTVSLKNSSLLKKEQLRSFFK
jgi:hypothetical protein